MPRNLTLARAALILLSFCAACSKNAPTTGATWTKDQWIRDAISAVASGRYPRVQALSYWHEKWTNKDGSVSNTRIDSSPGATAAYQSQIANPVFVSSPVFAAGKLQPPAGSAIYHAAFPDFGNTEDVVSAQAISAFETLAGKALTWAYFSNNWFNATISFPSANVAAIHAAGRVPYIRMMMRNDQNGGADSYYSLQNLASGTYDAALTQWATAAKAVGYPLIVEFGTEVTLDIFPWNGQWNGGAAGPAVFKSAYQHIVNLYNGVTGANNITWVYHVDAYSNPDAAWNTMAAYYPGDAYVDWIGVSAYGPQKPIDPYASFVSVMDPAYAELSQVSATKPIAVLEYGVTEPF